ncbi:class I SAM-dependent methyltransferase [Thalassoroseus pseudoceratinae]|uniref:class I SAM-dependent methyltransferase n=1 Tax=Thalassoroseus pseudoceratinae TaxID=2713176 RepID=UPI00141D8717|nr:class I SAM-dependent methyltransferase [Thalassoroseus pseudoceratinae]
MMRLTQLAQQRIGEVLPTGGFAIDATAGNGHDTLFLARRVGPGGGVVAIDKQSVAIEKTRERLASNSIENVQLILGDHADLKELIANAAETGVDAVMFNLGYLPGGDETQTTGTASSLQAIDAAIQVLKPHGLLSVVAYPGHPEGERETQAVIELFQRWSEARKIVMERVDVERPSSHTPILFLVSKQDSDPHSR